MSSVALCSIEWCDKVSKHVGMCSPHYQRKMRGADMNAPIRVPGSITHGVYTTYTNRHCRCDPCRDAWNLWRREKRAKARRPPFVADTNEHGTHRTYTKLRCRCPKCRAVNAKIAADRKAIAKNPLLADYQKSITACEICNKKSPLVKDHDHVSGDFRGLLCTSCNTALGKFADNTETMQAAIRYLERPTVAETWRNGQ